MDGAQFGEVVRPLVGMTVSRPWRGYGSTVGLELGDLRTATTGKYKHTSGEASIFVEGDWRIETDVEVVGGTSDSVRDVESLLASVKDVSIADIHTSGMPQELTVGFSNGCRLRSMVTLRGDARWHIRRPSGKLVHCERGVIVVGDDDIPAGQNDEECKMADRAEAAATRWGQPRSEPVKGQCMDCKHFVPLDGEADFLGYGVCAFAGSSLDGRVVADASGCQHFVE
jgi:hypothetical protein